MHLPYYFQYYTTECEDTNNCICPEENLKASVDAMKIVKIDMIMFKSPELKLGVKNETNNRPIYWTHCWSEFMNSTSWDIWYAAYQVCSHPYL